MNKKLITAVAAFLLLIPISANAALKNTEVSLPSIAILDTAIDSKLPQLNGKVIYEACFTSNSSCPGGKSFVEGTGAAYLPSNIISNNGFDHGTGITSVAIKSNPNVNIVFIRIIGNTPTGGRAVTPSTTIAMALNWATQNKDKFNIKAISMSQGHHNLRSTPDYCPKDSAVEAEINRAITNNIGVFFPAGNSWDSRLDWPACIPNSIAVGATDPNGYIAGYSNFDSNLIDFVTPGYENVLRPSGQTQYAVGTSLAVQVAAGNWATLASAKPTYTYQQLYDLLAKTSGSAMNSKYKTNRVINLQGALNG